jgi:hypothetical protein
VIGQYPVQMSSMEHDDVVQALAPNGADEAFRERTLPERTGSNELFLQAQGEGPRLEFQAVNAVAIARQVGWWVAVGESLGELLGGPLGRRRIRHIEVQDLSVLMRYEQEDKEDREGGGGDDEEIDNDEILGVVVEEDVPSFVRAPGVRTILADGRI